MYYQSIFYFLLFSFLISCNTTSTEDSNATSTALEETTVEEVGPKEHKNENAFVASVEDAHQRAAFLAKKAIQFDIVLTFGGSERLNGTILTTTNSRQGIITYQNGQKVYYKDDKVYYSPEMERSPESIRFGAYTWPYFFLFPYKLSDPGTNWAAYESSTLNEKEYLSQKLTFDAGTGDDPGDWYIAYADKESHLIDVAAYIVTAGGSTQAEAEVDPHAIQYKDYTMVEGVPIAKNWVFWAWRKEGGLTKELGAAALSNLKFVETDKKTFVVPDNFSTI